MRITVAIAGLAGLVAAGLAGGAVTPQITQTAVAGAKLARAPAAYRQALGGMGRWERGTPANPGMPRDYARLVFAKRKVSVYFVDGRKRGAIVTTWNKRYRTAAGVGPCSTVERLKAAYGTRLTPSKFNTINGVVYAYTLGKNLIFASNDQATVEVVGLYNGSDPTVLEPGGSLSYAGFITLSETRCS
jgi:hypothetical protein